MSSSISAAAAHSQHRPHRQGVQAALRRRRVLERRCRRGSSCSGSTPPRSSTRRNSTPISKQLEEAKRRDHRVLGKQLELFTISPTVGSGLILWLPKGAIIRQTLEEYIKGELRRRGYEAVYTPNIGRIELYQISGHFPYYSDSQFPPIEMEDGEEYLLKPMNCPHHIMIYKSKPRSYRDLPVRLAEFGTVYRFEQSGELNGMTRVRGFTQDDAHIFCTEEQVAGEFRGCLEMTQTVLASLGMDRLPRAARLPRSEERQVRRRRRSLGPGRSVAQSGLRVDELARHVDRAGRSGVLRTEGRLRRHRLHRPRVAARHRAARLQPAEQGAVRPRIHRRRQSSASAGDDPPRAARLDGAIRRRADRALRRRVPAVARAGASAGAHRERKERSVRPGSRSQAGRGRPCGRPATTAASSSTPRFARPSWSSSRTCSSSAKRTATRARSRSAIGSKATWERMPLADAIAKLQAEIAAKTVRQVAKPEAARRPPIATAKTSISEVGFASSMLDVG